MSSPNYPKAYLYMRIVQAKLFIEEKFAEPITIDIITSEASFSKFHFIRTFRIIYGQTPHQYLMNIRIERSKQLLKDGLNVVDVCHAVGFESITSFVGLFKKLTRQTPASFRKKHFREKNKMEASPNSFIPGCFAEKMGYM